MIATLSMPQLGLIFFTFFSITWTLTPVFGFIARKFQILDFPTQDHKSHTSPVPYLGGLAIVLPYCVSGALALVFLDSYSVVGNAGLTFFGLALMISILGLLDDIYPLSAILRLILQFSFSILAIYAMSTADLLIGFFPNSEFNVLVSLLWFVTMINAFNFVDNMDGSVTGISLVASLSIFVIALLGNQAILTLLSLSLAGSCLGFLFWNRSPAKIFLGDSGSLFLGFAFAALTIMVEPTTKSSIGFLATPILLLAIPLFDIILVTLNRIYRKTSPFQGGRDHLAHRLLGFGLSKESAVAFIWFLTILTCSTAILLQIVGLVAERILIAFSGIFLTVAFFFLFKKH